MCRKAAFCIRLKLLVCIFRTIQRQREQNFPKLSGLTSRHISKFNYCSSEFRGLSIQPNFSELWKRGQMKITVPLELSGKFRTFLNFRESNHWTEIFENLGIAHEAILFFHKFVRDAVSFAIGNFWKFWLNGKLPLRFHFIFHPDWFPGFSAAEMFVFQIYILIYSRNLPRRLPSQLSTFEKFLFLDWMKSAPCFSVDMES